MSLQGTLFDINENNGLSYSISFFVNEWGFVMAAGGVGGKA